MPGPLFDPVLIFTVYLYSPIIPVLLPFVSTLTMPPQCGPSSYSKMLLSLSLSLCFYPCFPPAPPPRYIRSASSPTIPFSVFFVLLFTVASFVFDARSGLLLTGGGTFATNQYIREPSSPSQNTHIICIHSYSVVSPPPPPHLCPWSRTIAALCE